MAELVSGIQGPKDIISAPQDQPWRPYVATREANVQARMKLIRAGIADKNVANDIWTLCRLDPLFFVDFFLMTYDPRRKRAKVLPFILWPYQENSVLQRIHAVEQGYSMVSEKSRDMGATYIATAQTMHQWLFEARHSYLFCSRKEDLVDTPGDPDSLLGKIDLYLDHLPSFLLPAYERKSLQFTNRENGSLISGESTNGDIGRGGRRTGVIMDEWASVPNARDVRAAISQATSSMFPISTPKGRTNDFYELRQNEAFQRETLHWTIHPLKRRGLYRCTPNGNVTVIDGQLPPGYSCVPDGKLRSPWYDEQCSLLNHPALIGQELDIDYVGSNYQFFESEKIDYLIGANARPAEVVGEFQGRTFHSGQQGRWKWWLPVNENGIIALDDHHDNPWILSADVAQGTGSSNSVISVGHKRLRRKVGEFSCPNTKPNELAELIMNVGLWLGGAYIIWEMNGPGRILGDALIEARYPKLHIRDGLVIKGEVLKNAEYGWNSTPNTKQSLLAAYRHGLASGAYLTPSRDELLETMEYIFDPTTGAIAHARSKNTGDPTGARDNHGDRVISSAMLYHVMKMASPLRKDSQSLAPLAPPVGSIAWHQRQDRARHLVRKFL